MTPLATLLLAAVLIGTSAGQLLFKAVSVRSARASSSYWLAVAADPLLWLALAVYGVELLLYMAFLSIVPLWQGVMVVSSADGVRTFRSIGKGLSTGSGP